MAKVVYDKPTRAMAEDTQEQLIAFLTVACPYLSETALDDMYRAVGHLVGITRT